MQHRNTKIRIPLRINKYKNQCTHSWLMSTFAVAYYEYTCSWHKKVGLPTEYTRN